MQIDSIDKLGQSAKPGLATKAPGSAFPSVLARRQESFLKATARQGTEPAGTAEEQARSAAQDFVAVALIAPILKQLRETNQAAAPFAPGAAEKQFRGLADAQVARQIAHASRYGLVDSLARRLLNKPVAVPPDRSPINTRPLLDVTSF